SLDDSNPNRIGARILYAETRNYGINRSVPWEPDRTVVTVNRGETAFSFLATDALSEGVRIPDLGMGVRASSKFNVQSSRLPELEAPTLNLEPETLNLPPPIYDRILT
ncbi:MAG: hypothetical protein NTU88_05015, partial [Armatimonadetes bacterium]|nr:hypothetical protein [Armatimonadota bacterium]